MYCLIPANFSHNPFCLNAEGKRTIHVENDDRFHLLRRRKTHLSKSYDEDCFSVVHILFFFSLCYMQNRMRMARQMSMIQAANIYTPMGNTLWRASTCPLTCNFMLVQTLLKEAITKTGYGTFSYHLSRPFFSPPLNRSLNR